MKWVQMKKIQIPGNDCRSRAVHRRLQNVVVTRIAASDDRDSSDHHLTGFHKLLQVEFARSPFSGSRIAGIGLTIA